MPTDEKGMPILRPSKAQKQFRASLPSMANKVVAITGCTSGTGKICAITCAELGAKVVMINRASSRADAALKTLQSVCASVGAPEPLLVPCDLMDFESVREAAAQLNTLMATSGLDVLCNNAGIMGFGDIATKDGCDIQMQTNHMSHFLLTCLCMPLLEKAASLHGEARIVNHSSSARKMDPPMFNTLDAKYLEKNGGNLGGSSHTMLKGANFQRYQQTKLANVVFTYALNDRLQAAGSSVKALVAHPGVAPTSLSDGTMKAGGMEDSKAAPKWLMALVYRIIMQSEEDGAMGILRCCCDPDVVPGGFYGPKGAREGEAVHDTKEYKGPAVLKKEEPLADAEARAMLWEVSERVTECKFNI